MTDVHQWDNINFSALTSCFLDHIFLVSDFRQLPCRYFSSFAHYFPLLPLQLVFECLKHRNKFVWQVAMTKWIYSLCNNMILMTRTRSSFQSNSRGLVGIDNANTFGLVFPNAVVDFFASIYWYFARHYCWHWNFELPTSILEFLIKFSGGQIEFPTIWMGQSVVDGPTDIHKRRMIDALAPQQIIFPNMRANLPHQRMTLSIEQIHESRPTHSLTSERQPRGDNSTPWDTWFFTK